MKIVSAHQPAFLPWIGYLEKIALAETFVMMDIAKFRKRSFMHRNKIEINGNPFIVGIHTEKDADFKNCDEIFINKNFDNDLENISNKIREIYKKEKFYSDVSEFCEETLRNEFNNLNLIDLSLIQIKYLFRKFDISTEIIKESTLLKKEDLSTLDASNRLLLHAKKLNADIYITGINSKNYLDEKIFLNAEILNYVQDFNYDSFLSIQKSNEPLSIIHQIAKLGFDNIKNWLKEDIIEKNKIILNYKNK